MTTNSKDYLLKESKTFCMFPWIHLYSNPDGAAFPCCTAEQDEIDENTKNKTLDEIFNSTDWKQLRLDMLNGVENKVCRRCHEVDKSGGFSYRSYANNDFGKFIDIVDNTNIDGSIETPEYKFIDIRFSNHCNFACSTCGPVFSTAWGKKVKEYQKTDPNWFDPGYTKIENNTKKSIFEQLKPHFYNAEEIYFAGGEPLIMDDHYRILGYLNDNSITDLRLRYNSNLSNLDYKKENIIHKWKNIREVKIGASIDGVKDVAELIRTGTNWDVIEKNMTEILSYENISLNIDTVVSILNISHLPTMYNYLFDNNLLNKRSWLTTNLAFTPVPYSLTSLPIEYKNKFANIINDYIMELKDKQTPLIEPAKKSLIHSLKSIIEFMYSKDTFQQEDLLTLIKWTIFDKEKFKTVLPDIYDLNKELKDGR
jgi:organic radical activating enzyme